MLQAVGTIWFRFLQKKYLKKFHACVPLNLVTVGGEIRQPFDAKILDELISRFSTAVCEVIAGIYSIINL